MTGRVFSAALAPEHGEGYLTCMDTVPTRAAPQIDAPQLDAPETEAERQARFEREAEGIAEARAELVAGLYVDADDIDAWIDSIGTDHELPPPPTRHR